MLLPGGLLACKVPKQYCTAHFMEPCTYMPCIGTRMLQASTLEYRIFLVIQVSHAQIRTSCQAQLALSTQSITNMVRAWVTYACHHPLGAADSPGCSPVTRAEMQQSLLTASVYLLACQHSRCYAAQ